jgi:hypothetical protein
MFTIKELMNNEELLENRKIADELLEAITIIATDGRIEPEPGEKYNISFRSKKYEKSWEKCTVILTRDELDRSNGRPALPIEPTVGEILFEDGSPLYKSDGSVLRKGPWIERFISYSKKVQDKYKKEQQERINQEKEEKLKPFLNIDF